MKRLQIIALTLTLSCATPQAVAWDWSRPEWVKSVVSWSIENPSKSIPIATVIALATLYEILKRLWKSPEEKLFGFNPNVQGLPTQHSPQKKSDDSQKTALILLPGKCAKGATMRELRLSDTKDPSLEETQKINDHFFTVTYNTGVASSILKPHYLNLGGIEDITLLAYAAKKCTDAGNPIVLFGFCMGGATIVRFLHALSEPISTEYKTMWQKLGLWNDDSNQPETEAIKKIQNNIKKVFIANPLLDVPLALQQIHPPKILCRLDSLYLKIFTLYQNTIDQPVNLLEKITNMGGKIHFGFMPQDDTVGDAILNKYGNGSNNFTLLCQKNKWEISYEKPEKNALGDHLNYQSSRQKLREFIAQEAETSKPDWMD